MHTDVSRESFDNTKNILRVVQQQGGVVLDADANEQTAILLHRLHTLAADLFGPFWGPAGRTGFKVEGVTAKNFTISDGKYYVAGRSAENATTTLNFGSQPYYPIVVGDDDLKPPFLVYLDVWERLIPAGESLALGLDDPALGNVDTSRRTQLVWQVRVKSLDPTKLATAKTELVNTKPLVDVLRYLDSEPIEPRPTDRGLKAESLSCGNSEHGNYEGVENQLYRVEIHRTGQAGVATFKWSRGNGSVVYPIAAALKGIKTWEVDPDGLLNVTLVHIGRDERTRLKKEACLEYVDNVTTLAVDRLQGLSYPKLFEVVDVGQDQPFEVTLRQLTAKDATPLPLPPLPDGMARWAYFRRWDHDIEEVQEQGKTSPAHDGALLVVAKKVAEDKDIWLELEDGIRIQFESGKTYQAGDYWLIPARTNTRNIIWPTMKDGWVPARNTDHSLAPLAVVEAAATVVDCRRAAVATLTGPPSP